MDVHENGETIELTDMDEDFITICNSSPEDIAFDEVVDCIGDILIGDEFQQLRKTFLEKHYQEFDNSEENRLSYTSIFTDYVDLLQNHLQEQLMRRIPGFHMTDFEQLLMQHKEIPQDIFDTLETFIDFMAFKEMILKYKDEKEGRGLDLSKELVVISLKPNSNIGEQ